MSAKVAVVLSGCGVFDGAEIHESVLTLLALQKQGAAYQCFAPNVDQHHVLNHMTGEEMSETRNVLIESSRIARGDIKDLKEFSAANFDALIFPGGFGAAKNLSSFAFEGADCSVNEDVAQAVKTMLAASKPIGALCIAPAIMAKIIDGPKLTIGQDADTAAALETMGATHKITDHGEVIVDMAHKLVTTPCYMLDANVAQIAEGADNAVKAVLDLV
ncbi:MAG: isoprenoid biosynthesis glyoxalase ElbB [Alphaproteobacteria bacterium]|nr:isoprenoid biosynthesis glyoxalase ElbB [Rhodospirillales bacterium]MCW9044893.1 isoprenoid biosynthesis glyoxalase ElbB [Alphaproteobacteria bacterium]